MRVTIATGPLLPVPAVAGGAIPRMWLGLAQEFVRRGHEVEIVARDFRGQGERESIGGVRIRRFGGFGQSRFLTFDLVRNLFYSLRVALHLPSADVLVSNDFWLPLIAAALRPSAGRIVVNANRYPKGQYRLYGRSASIAAASSVVGREVARQCPALTSRIRVIPNPIDTLTFRPPEYPPSGPEKVLLFVGRLHPEKGVHSLVEAFARFHAGHPEWRLRLVGPVSEDRGGGGVAYERKLTKVARSVPVEFAGPIFDHRELARILGGATLFCYPSFAEKGEALPVAPLEAMACGLPLLVSDLECFRDYLVDGETGFVFDHRSGDPVGSLAARLEELTSEPERLTKVGACGLEMARRFGYQEVAGQYLAEFERILAGVSGSAQR